VCTNPGSCRSSSLPSGDGENSEAAKTASSASISRAASESAIRFCGFVTAVEVEETLLDVVWRGRAGMPDIIEGWGLGAGGAGRFCCCWADGGSNSAGWEVLWLGQHYDKCECCWYLIFAGNSIFRKAKYSKQATGSGIWVFYHYQSNS
jgi:hypothetical protein